jgi:hypothetical protein
LFTTEHAKTAEIITAIARHQDIFFSSSLSGDLSGIARRAKPEASRLFGFLSALSDLGGEQKKGSDLTAASGR